MLTKEFEIIKSFKKFDLVLKVLYPFFCENGVWVVFKEEYLLLESQVLFVFRCQTDCREVLQG